MQLKSSQVEFARQAGFRHIAGRMRVGLANAVIQLNTKLGAYEVQRIPNAYADDLEPRDCFYYHIDL